MASTTLQDSSTSIRVAPIALATVVAATVLNAFGVYGDGTPGESPDHGAFFFVIGLTVVAAAIVFGAVVPRLLDRPKAGGVGLGLSIAALVFVLAFWSGLTPVLGVGGILLGQAARSRGRGIGNAAVAIGSLALVADVAVYVADWMATNNIAGM